MQRTNEYLPNRVYDTLKDNILYCRIKPGTALSEIETAKQFHVSRTPVRDAFRRLQADGLIEVKPHIGTFVTLIDLDQIMNTIFIRSHVEMGVILELFTQMSETKELSLKMIVAKQKELLHKPLDDEHLAIEFMKLDDEFHRQLYKITGRIEIWDMLMNLSHDYVRFRSFIALSDDENLQNTCKQHNELIEMILRQDRENIDQLFNHHLLDGIRHATPKILEYQNYFTNIAEFSHK